LSDNEKNDESQVYPVSPKVNPENQGDFFKEVTLSDKPILLMLNLVIQTAFIKTCSKPISLLLVGVPGLGKSRILSPLAKLKYVSYVNDITPKYLVEFLKQVDNGEKKFLVIPDFTNCTSHGKSTKNTLIAILRSMTEEGVTDLKDYHLEFTATKKPVKAGLITAITNSSYREFNQTWKSTGFLSRLLPFSFDHSVSTKDRIMDDIDTKKLDQITKIKFKIEKRPPEITNPNHLLRQLRVYEQMLSKSTDSLPYRHQIQLNSITESLAILRGNKEITQEDIEIISWLCNWINYEFKEI